MSAGHGMPIDREVFETGEPVTEREWSRYERKVRKYLEYEFHQQFTKRRITIGKPREFDAVSEDGTTLVQIKYTGKSMDDLSDQQRRHYRDNYMFDALRLEKAPGKKKILVMNSYEMRDWFVEETQGLLSPEIEVIAIPYENH